MRYRSVEFSKDGESTPTILLWKCCKIRWIWRVTSGLRAQALGMKGVIQCRLQAGFFVSAQSSVQVKLRVKLLLEAILISCKLRIVEITSFDAKPYHKLCPRLSRWNGVDPMKLLAFQKRVALGSSKYAGPLCCSLNSVVEPEAGLLQPHRAFG
jgi:hypothetical protein